MVITKIISMSDTKTDHNAADHDKLCRTWCGTDQCTEKLRHRRERGKWPGNGGRIYDRDRADGRYP